MAFDVRHLTNGSGLVAIGTLAGLGAAAFDLDPAVCWAIAMGAAALVPLPFVLKYERDHPEQFKK